MCKHVFYTAIVNFQMNIVYRRKINNRKKKETGNVWLVGVHCTHKTYLSIVTTQQKTRQRYVRRLLMRVKTYRRVRRVLMMGKAPINDG